MQDVGYWTNIPVGRKQRRIFVTTSEYARKVQRDFAWRLAAWSYFFRRCSCGLFRPITAYAPKSSVHDHVRLHMECAARWPDAVTYKMDIKDCFNSLMPVAFRSYVRAVYRTLLGYDYGISINQASVVALKSKSLYGGEKMCDAIWSTIMSKYHKFWLNFESILNKHGKIENRKVQALFPYCDDKRVHVVGQGPCTSPHFSNIMLLSFDSVLMHKILEHKYVSEGPVHDIGLFGQCGHKKAQLPFAYSRYADDILITTSIDTDKMLEAIEFALLLHGLKAKYVEQYKQTDRINVCGFTWTVGEEDIRPTRRVRRRLRALRHIYNKYNETKGGQLQCFEQWADVYNEARLGSSKAARVLKTIIAANA